MCGCVKTAHARNRCLSLLVSMFPIIMRPSDGKVTAWRVDWRRSIFVRPILDQLETLISEAYYEMRPISASESYVCSSDDVGATFFVKPNSQALGCIARYQQAIGSE